MNLHSYPSIYNLGHRALEALFLDPVVVEEKVDGSQFSFGKIDGEFFCRSKGKNQTPPNTDKLFERAVAAVSELPLRDGWTYRGEYLQKPKHNTLAYSRIPANHVILFDIEHGDQFFLSPEDKRYHAEELGLECVPCYRAGLISNWEDLKQYLEMDSVLGGAKVEGIVIKNYARYGPDKKVLMGKYVSEAFKERHGVEWKKANPGQSDIITEIVRAYNTPARWEKAIQHLRDSGELVEDVQDIGPLLREIQQDVHTEEAEGIKEVLFKWAWKSISRGVTAGFPEWYKERLAKAAFEEAA